uniref:MoCF_biosynth domain-containing protein n=1 Tax=Globodera pallida TaxID=36090 RepID=A0A183CDX0_GLOPA
MNFSVLIVSDSSDKDQKLDKSGPLLVELLKNSALIGRGGKATVADYTVVPDEKSKIVAYLREYSAKVDCILTSGGTGFSKRDVTPEATREVIESECPGIAVALLKKGLDITPFAALTRLTAGIAGNCLIINLPGSPKAVREGFEVLEPILNHAIAIIKGDESETSVMHNRKIV